MPAEKTHHRETVTLNNGVEMPILGFGVFQVGPDETHAAVAAAIAASGVPREELFITTKLWVQEAPAEENTTRAFETSLRKLGLDYVDLYLIHQPFGDYYGQWRAVEKVNKDGRARAIGVSNFAADRLLDLVLNTEITPAIDQIEINPCCAG